MNAPATLSAPASSVQSNKRPAPRRRNWLWFARLLLGLVLLAAASFTIPSVFQFTVRQLISYQVYRWGGNVSVENVGGSLWEPVTLTQAHWVFPFRRGSVLRLDTAQLQANFSWRELFSQDGGRWFQRLSIQGVSAKVELPPNPDEKASRHEKRSKPQWLPAPARVEISDLDLTVAANSDFVRFQDGELTISDLEPGTIRFGQIAVKQPWLAHTFRHVKGTTAVQDSKVVIADLILEPGVSILAFSAEMNDLIAGRLNADIKIAAFGGEIRAQAQTLPTDEQTGIETSGFLSKPIGIAPLTTFLGVSDAAGGTIKAGHFMFRGSPRNLPRAAASLRLEAINFQWESRQWDSLVLGATFHDRRVQIPELELRQGHNHLSLNGEMGLPSAHTTWWQSDFAFNIAAKIENLTELSALLLPEFKYAAGKMNIDGAVRGKDLQFNGALIVSGSSITWRNAPIEELHAALKITGNELQVANFELLNQDDFVRGRGVVNILGAKQYWGELRASVVDLAQYAALLQPPIMPEPLAGGAVFNWSGEGSAKGHSGKFLARLQKLKSLGATGAFIHPLQADLEGVYGSDRVQFSRFSLSDEQSAFTANVTIADKELSLQDIRLTHGNDLWLEGGATLPLDVWRVWPNTTLATMLTEGVPSKINLTAHQLQLRDASRLTGWKWPIEGVVEGSISVEGIVGMLNTNGNVTIQNARIPLTSEANAFTNLSAELALAGQTLTIKQLTTQHPSGNYTATGQVDFTNIRDTALNLSVKSDAATLAAFRKLTLPVIVADEGKPKISVETDHLDVTSRLDLTIAGSAATASITGTAQILKLGIGGIPDTTSLWRTGSVLPLPPVFNSNGSPWDAWKLDVGISAQNASIDPTGGTLTSEMRLVGTGATPSLKGELHIEQSKAVAGGIPLRIERGTITFRDGSPSIPSIELHVAGELLDTGFIATMVGPLSHLVREFSAVPPLTDEMVKNGLLGQFETGTSLNQGDETFSLSAPAGLTGNTPIYEWPEIVLEEAPAPAAPADTPDPSPSPAESAQPSAGSNS